MKPASNGKYQALEPPPPLTSSEGLAEANRCLMCWDAPCTRACPTHIDVPRFIKQIATDDLLGSARTILSANILGASCARVCPTEVLCEGACVLHDLHERPIEIGRLQGLATDPVVFGGDPIFVPGPDTGFRIAIVGAGPAGLSCAAELTRLGHSAVILDAADIPGGLNTHGVAEYKMRPDTSLAEVEWVLSHGGELRSGVRVGTDITIDALLEEHDAVFIGTGLARSAPLGIPGEDLAGVEAALDFIANLKARPREEAALEGERVAVIGAGNTAIDAATQSVRLGADKVFLVFRRAPEHMRAYDHEIEKALLDGVELVAQAVPVSITGQGAVGGLTLQRTELGAPGRDGRPAVKALDGTEFHLDVTRVVRATGQVGYHDFYAAVPDVELDGAGRVVVDERFRTGNVRIWAGGDCVNGGKEVVNAVEHGKQAARDIDATLHGVALPSGGD
ncbi:MAG: NAD(P)-dependent oxidoreductase [Acidimicrobiia bacterium]|nr:NAD(P)-dependent oxidoreductase [Acidimicrobiia bacterium]